RAGLAYGRVLSRFGDIYGSVVNIAARLSSIARPGSVLIDRSLALALEDSPGYTIRHRRPTSVRGYARLRPSVLRRGGAEVFVRDLPDGTEIPHLPLVPDDGRRR